MEQPAKRAAHGPLKRRERDGVAFLLIAFVLCSAAISVAILGFRNIFDDEIFSLPFVTGSVHDLLATAREGDVHPPGMYLLAHAAWTLVHSYRWLNLIPMGILYAGLAVYLLSFARRLPDRRAAVVCALLATLHPELLMWSNTLRWYAPWTGLALMALVLFLQPGRRQWELGWGEAIGGGVLLAGMFYLNYITLLFAIALAGAVVMRVRGWDRRSLAWVCVCAGVFLCLAAPQVHTMLTVHLPNSRAQRSGIAISLVKLTQALAGSEAYLPWNLLAIAAGAVVLVLLAGGYPQIFRREATGNDAAGNGTQESWLKALAVFGAIFFVLVVVTGLGGKPRSAIVLVPAFGPVAGVGAARLRGRRYVAIVAVLVAWSGLGATHLIGRFGLQKSSMNDRPEQVVRLIAREQGAAAGDQSCGVAITYDGGVAFALGQARVPGLMILSPYRGALFAGTLLSVPEACARPRLYLVQSYVSGEPDRDAEYIRELKAAEGLLTGPQSLERLSPDRDAAMKRRVSRFAGLSAGTSLPDYRFVVLSGRMDRARLGDLRRTLHYFVSGEEVVPDEPAQDGDGGSD